MKELEERDLTIKHLFENVDNHIIEVYIEIRNISTVVIKKFKECKDVSTSHQHYDLVIDIVGIIFESYLSILNGYLSTGEDLSTREFPKMERVLGYIHGLKPFETKGFYQEFYQCEIAKLNEIDEEDMSPSLNFMVYFITHNADRMETIFDRMDNNYKRISDMQKQINDHKAIYEKQIKRVKAVIAKQQEEVACRARRTEEYASYVWDEWDDISYHYHKFDSDNYSTGDTDYEDNDMEEDSSDEEAETSANDKDLNSNGTESDLKKDKDMDQSSLENNTAQAISQLKN